MESEIIYGWCPSKKNHYQSAINCHGKSYIYKDKTLTGYEENFARQCKIYAGRKIDYPFVLYFVLFTDNSLQDLDNPLNTVLDCLEMVEAICNDNLCRKIVAERRAANGVPRVQFAIVPYSTDARL